VLFNFHRALEPAKEQQQVNGNAIKLSEIQGAFHEHGQRLFDIEDRLARLHQNKYDQEQGEAERVVAMYTKVARMFNYGAIKKTNLA